MLQQEIPKPQTLHLAHLNTNIKATTVQIAITCNVLFLVTTLEQPSYCAVSESITLRNTSHSLNFVPKE